MKIKNIIYYIIIIFPLVSSCIYEKDNEEVEGEMATVKISIEPEELEESFPSKYLNTTQENTIYNYHILVYNSDGELKSKGYSTSSAKLTLKVPIGN
ncbi:MAG: hypothetical protein E6767_20780, partial [Dysgonomonas sp.]|nr:hypothetical protein [Dysgonomonas sp.]